MSDISKSMNEIADAVTDVMDALMPRVSGPRGRVVDAMRYACLGGGKRLRPFLLVSSADIFDAPRSGALRAAAWAAGRVPGLYDMQDVLGLRD